MRDGNLLSSIVRLFISTDRLHKSYVDRFIGNLGIHRSQHIALMHLSRMGEMTSQKELAEHLKISPAAVAVSLKKLEADGYIERISDSSDGRFNRIHITEKGRETVNKSREIFTQIDSAMCGGLEDYELDRLYVYLEKMYEGLKSLEGKEF